MKDNAVNIRQITLIALMSALIFVLTVVPRIPIPGSPDGYVHLGDTGIIFAASAFGPVIAAVAGGLGTAVADLVAYPQWAVFSLIVHGLQGLAVGMILRKQIKVVPIILATLVSIVIVAGGYFLTEVILYGSASAFVSIPYNVIQALSGSILGIPLTLAVRSAYPQLSQLAGSREEE